MAQHRQETNPYPDLETARRKMYTAGAAMILFGALALTEGVLSILEIPVESVPFIGWALGAANGVVEGGLLLATARAGFNFRNARRAVKQFTSPSAR